MESMEPGTKISRIVVAEYRGGLITDDGFPHGKFFTDKGFRGDTLISMWKLAGALLGERTGFPCGK